ncbi:MAG: flagellar biosynthetic protein FliQ [Alphaproteobacteria bacterium]
MDLGTVVDVAVDALFATLLAGAPLMAAALVVGVGVSLLQALTQVQEMTLTFVPKLVAMFVTAIVALPFMISVIVDLGEELFGLIVTIR